MIHYNGDTHTFSWEKNKKLDIRYLIKSGNLYMSNIYIHSKEIKGLHSTKCYRETCVSLYIHKDYDFV